MSETTAHSIPLIQLGTLVSSLIVISVFLTKYHLSLSKSCYYHIRELCSIRPYLDFKTASTIDTSVVHSKLDYCNSVYYNLPKSQINRLQVIENSLARAVVKAPKFCYVTPILKSLHWLKSHIEYKLLSLTYKGLTTAQPTYLHSLITVQPLVLLAPHLLSSFLDHLHLLL